MKGFPSFAKKIYTRFLGLYPIEFQRNFKDEMLDIFSQLMGEAKNKRLLSEISVFWKETRSLPQLITREHFSHKKPESHTTQLIPLIRRMVMETKTDNWKINDPKTAILSVLPLFLFGLGISLTWWIIAGPWYEASEATRKAAIYIGLIPIVGIAIGGIWSFIKRIPNWSPIWLGVNIAGAALVAKSIAEEFPYLPTNPLFGVLLVIGGLGAVAIGLIISLRSWEQAALFGISLSSTICLFNAHTLSVGPLSHVHFGLWAVFAGLLLSALTYIFITKDKKSIRTVILTAIAILNLISVVFVSHSYASWLVAQNQASFLIPLSIFVLVAFFSGLFVQFAKNSLQKIRSKN